MLELNLEFEEYALNTRQLSRSFPPLSGYKTS